MNQNKCEYDDDPNFPCEGEVEIVHAMTAYHFEGEKNSPEDPNRDRMMCKAHAEDYRAYWRSMWEDYYSGLV